MLVSGLAAKANDARLGARSAHKPRADLEGK